MYGASSELGGLVCYHVAGGEAGFLQDSILHLAGACYDTVL